MAAGEGIGTADLESDIVADRADGGAERPVEPPSERPFH